ncbi:MAG: EAL domain-containing protein [Nitriliruptoraceae bacterium]
MPIGNRTAYGVLAALVIAYPLVPGAADRTTGALSHWGTVCAVASLAVFVFGVVRNRPASRTPWVGLGAFLVLWMLGDLAYDLAGTHPVLSPADGFYVAGAVAGIAALLAMNQRRLVDAPRDALIESGMVALIAAIAAWLFIVEYAIDAGGPALGALGRSVVVFYPLVNVVALFLVARLLFSGGRNIAALLLGAAFICGLAADGAYAYFQQMGSFSDANVVAADTLWLAMYALIAAATLHPSMVSLTEPTRGSSTRTSWQLATAGIALLAIPTLFAAAGLLGHTLHTIEFFLASATVIPLVLWRLLHLHRWVTATHDQLERREHYFRQLAQQSSDSYFVLDEQGIIRDMSPGATRMLGVHDDVHGQQLTAVVGDDGEHLATALAGIRTLAGMSTTVEAPLPGSDGSIRWIEARATNMLDDATVRGIVVNVHDISLRKHALAEVERQSLHDPLTGLPNRALLRDRMERVLVRRRQHGNDVVVVFCGLDNFMDVNESLGHDRGDDVLRTVADRLVHAVASSDTIARLGGDEFAALIEVDDVNDQQAIELAESIRQAATSPIRLGGLSVAVTASVGVAIASADDANTVDDLLRIADSALAAAKARGRDQVVRYQPSMRQSDVVHMELADELRSAVARNELALHYQPIFDLSTGAIVGLEALARWNHPTRGLLPPRRFIPIAEQSGSIIDVGTWVLRRTCEAAATFDDNLLISVNLAPRQLRDPDIVATIRGLLDATGLEPSRLALELTESALIGNFDEAVTRLRAISRLGVKIAIDDFGVGFASIDYLRRFPTDILKIDASYVSSITEAGDVSALVRGLLGLGRTLDLITIAEGIETSPQLAALQREGCAYGQGFILERAVSEHQIRELLGTPPSPTV